MIRKHLSFLDLRKRPQTEFYAHKTACKVSRDGTDFSYISDVIGINGLFHILLVTQCDLIGISQPVRNNACVRVF